MFPGKDLRGSAEATKGAPVSTHWGDWTCAANTPPRKGRQGCFLDLGTRVGWRASRGGGAREQPTHYASFLTLGGVGGWGPGRRAGGEGAMGGGTRLVWGRRRVGCGGGQLSFLGHEGGYQGGKGVKWRGLTRCGGTPGYA